MRAIGSMRVSSNWGRNFPCYAVDEAGQVQRRGTFATGRPLRTALYSILAKERVLQYFKVDIPSSYTDRSFAFTAALIDKSRKVFQEQVEGGKFSVLIYPARPGMGEDSRRIIPFLEAAGIPYYDYGDLLNGMKDEELWLRDGLRLGYGHPKGATHDRVGATLVSDLGIGPIVSGN
jgi:hypothetical protein